MEPRDVVGFAAALALMVVIAVVGLRDSFSPAGRRRRSAQRQVRARLRQSTTRHPLAARTTAVRVLFTLLGLGLLGPVLQSGIELDPSSPGLWLPLLFIGLAAWTMWVSAVPLVLDLVDHGRRRSFDGVVVDRIRDTYEAGGGEGSCTAEAYYVVVSGDTAAPRAYQVTRETMAQYRQGDRVTMTVAPRSGYVYAMRTRAGAPVPGGPAVG